MALSESAGRVAQLRGKRASQGRKLAAGKAVGTPAMFL